MNCTEFEKNVVHNHKDEYDEEDYSDEENEVDSRHKYMDKSKRQNAATFESSFDW